MAETWENIQKEAWFQDAFAAIQAKQNQVKKCVVLAKGAGVLTSNKMSFVSACVKFVHEFSRLPTASEVKGWGLDKPVVLTARAKRKAKARDVPEEEAEQ